MLLSMNMLPKCNEGLISLLQYGIIAGQPCAGSDELCALPFAIMELLETLLFPISLCCYSLIYEQANEQ